MSRNGIAVSEATWYYIAAYFEKGDNGLERYMTAEGAFINSQARLGSSYKTTSTTAQKDFSIDWGSSQITITLIKGSTYFVGSFTYIFWIYG